MVLTTPIAPKLYDDPVIAYNEIAATVPAGERYCQSFDYSIIELPKCTTAKYLEVSFPNSPITDASGIDSWDITQGALGCCGSAAELACYGSIPSDSDWALEKGIYPLERSPISLYLVRVFDCDTQSVKWVAIDSKAPCENTVSSKSTCIWISDGQPLAPALLIKAKCTMKGGSFDTITNSDPFRKPFSWFPEVTFKCDTFAKFKEALSYGGIAITAMTQQYDADGLKINPPGVVLGHAFGLVDCIEHDGHQLVRIENPWGPSTSDYLSPYSDDAPFWDAYPELAVKRADARAGGGNYWVDWETLKKLTGKTSFDVSVPMPNPKYPHLQYFREEMDGEPNLGTEWWTWKKRIFDRTPSDQVKRITIDEPTTLQVETSWMRGTGDRHTRVYFMDAIGTVVASTQEASWGGKKVSEITLQPGVYGMYPLANQNVDRGLLQVRIYSSTGGWHLV